MVRKMAYQEVAKEGEGCYFLPFVHGTRGFYTRTPATAD